MGMLSYGGLLGLSGLIPATVFLTVSFFILVIARKLESQGLKIFGHMIVVLLWITSALVFVAGVIRFDPRHYMQQIMCNKNVNPIMQSHMMRSGMQQKK